MRAVWASRGRSKQRGKRTAGTTGESSFVEC
jgi:hypothetical protein